MSDEPAAVELLSVNCQKPRIVQKSTTPGAVQHERDVAGDLDGTVVVKHSTSSRVSTDAW